jgi:Trypsin-like peptidase domain
LTAAHVIHGMQRSKRCPNSAITLPADGWHPATRTENLAWFPFRTSSCRADNVLAIAVCRLSEDLSARRWDLHLRAEPVEFEWNIPPDGTPVAFTGFPLRARDPMTFRAAVAAYLIPWSEKPIPELVLDHASLPGFSGSPVYLADGKIVAILVQGGTGETNGIAIARPASVFREMIGKKLQRK